jgi:ATP-dependent helicase/nuclease subunit A
MNNWTDEQQQAIESRNSNLLVAAAAGSGKTAVLVERIIRMVCQDGLNIDNLLIVTFTNAAAGEMRERITAAIIRELESNPENPEHLRLQLQMIGRSSICTVHAFCTNVVRDNFHLLDIDPKFRIGDTTECSILRRETVEEILEEAYKSGEENFLGLVDRFSGSRNDKPVEDLILRTYSFIQSQPQPLTWLAEKTGQFVMTEDELARSDWADMIIQDLQLKITEAGELFAAAAATVNLDPGLEGYRPALDDDLQIIAQLDDCLQSGLQSLLQSMQTIRFTRLGRAARDCDPRLQEQVKQLRNEGKKLISELQDLMAGKSLADYTVELGQLYPSMQSLLQLTDNFMRHYQEKKAEKGILDFDDLEHFALRVLRDPEAARIYKDKYHYIFVDEYQDSNLVQETLLGCIKGENNLFMVGDVKQSIYRFRLADPTLFIAKYHAFQPQPHVLNRRIDLDKNFRSRAEILAGVNYIFQHIMSERLGEIDYDQSAFLCYGSRMEEAEDARIEVMLIEKDSSLLELEEDLEDVSEIEIEAGFAARRIKELIGQSVYDPRQKCIRPLEYRDMVVLMRSTKNRADAYLDILTDQGIPAYADVGSGYFETLEIEMFLNLLRLIDNKKQDIALLSVLRSPIGKFTVEDLIAIRLDSHATHMYLALEDYIKNNDNDLSKRLSAFWMQLGKWKDKSRFLPIDQLIWEIMLETDYFYFVGAMPGGIQRQANLRILLDRARQFQASTLKGLFNFVNFIDSLQSDRGDMGNARVLGEEDNVVRIMSIHKSKGLEFPVVILAGMGKQFNLQDTNAAVLFHKDLGIGPVHVDPEARIKSNSFARMAIQSKLKQENLSEEMRILYVGCTRAINKLILLGSFKNIPGLAKKWSRSLNPYGLGKARNFMDWIGPVLINHPDGEILRDLLEDGCDPLETDTLNSSWTVSVLNPAQLSAARLELQQQQSSIRDRLMNFTRDNASTQKALVYERLNWNYPFRQAEGIPSKLSVTSIKKIQTSNWPAGLPDPPPRLPGPDFIVNDKNDASAKLSGAEKGTVMHFVMQHLDLSRVSSTAEIQLQLQEMLACELLTAEEANAVQIDKIARFFHSGLGQRMLNSPAVFREVPFNLVCRANRVLDNLDQTDDELLVQGVIDLYFQEGDELVLVDYKTDYINNQNRDALIQQYSIQINMYKEALEEILRKKVKESYFYFFHTEEMIAI